MQCVGLWKCVFLLIISFRFYVLGTLYKLISAANYLDAEGLLAVTCMTVRDMAKGKTTQAMRKTFNIKDDFTSAEEERDADMN